MHPRLLPILTAMCVALVVTSTQAAERLHTVIAGESASGIAKEYYGEFSMSDLLLHFNDRGDSVLHPGERLRIPYSETHRVSVGDSWSGIAKRYLGRPSAWRAIAALNGFEGNAVLRPGQQVVVPVVLDYRLRRGESLAILAERFYGDAQRASMLAEFNGIDDPRRLSVGQELGIPLTDFRLKPSPVAARTEPPPREIPRSVPAPVVSAVPSDDPELGRELGSARQAWRAGEYARARTLLESLDADGGSPGQQAEYWRLLAFVHVAFDAPERACNAWSEIDPEQNVGLDPDLVSPKIREMLAACAS